METKIYKSQVYWACRRGMLELDSMLIPFCENCFDDLSDEEKEQLWLLLKNPDQTLHDWFMNRETPENPEFLKLIQKIQQNAKTYQND